jgi:hypothetical protein
MDDAVQQLVDRRDIEDLVHRYAFAIDARDWAAIDELFLPDAYVSGTTSQARYPEYIAALRPTVEQYHTTMHFLGNQLSRVEGDTGHVDTYAVAFHLGEGTPEIVVGVCYRDDVARIDGRWRITGRAVTGLWRRALAGEIVPLSR